MNNNKPKILSILQKKTVLVLTTILMASLLLVSCAGVRIVEKKHYLMDYFSEPLKKQLVRQTPYQENLLILETSIPRLYDRTRMVVRSSNTLISFTNNNVWAQKPSESITNLITDRINAYNMFTRVQRKTFADLATLILKADVKRIEYLQIENQYAAQLVMDLYLTDSNQENVFVKYSVKRQKAMFTDDFEVFAQMITEIVVEETDNFLLLADRYFQTPATPIAADVSSGDEFSTITKESVSSVDLLGMGKLLMPALTDSDMEPVYDIYTSNWTFVDNGIMGEPVLLKPGVYNIKFGSGTDIQKQSKEIEVIPGKKTIVEPDWACLTVNVIDENRNSINTRYEIFDIKTTESYGTGRGVLEEKGEKVPTWVLPAAKYKLTVNSMPFNTYTDFVTFDLIPGYIKDMVIVVDSETGQIRGAGELYTDETLRSRKGKISSAIHANANITNDNSQDKDKPVTKITFNTQLDTRFEYDEFPIQYTFKNLIEIGTIKDTDTDFRIAQDNFSLKNTFIYYFFKYLGAYVRADASTHFFQEKINNPSTANFKFVDRNDDVSYHLNTKSIKVKNAIFPLSLKEGIGMNLRLLNSTRSNLNLRAGYGMTQDFNKDYYSYSGQITENDTKFEVYKENENVLQEGMEMSVVSSFMLPFNVTYSSNADLLIPFDKNKSANFEWENIINLRLVRHLSLDYKVNFNYKKDHNNYLLINQTLYLRLTYFIY
ncbi:MAG: ABC-type transport auxiliary lipoprotein family protein [Candidatus Cloacimonetes bacterium]|nr:ABC-type transport auxiliary lipoprotein family protein [Candidatus Cloacimonadota bacterium]